MFMLQYRYCDDVTCRNIFVNLPFAEEIFFPWNRVKLFQFIKSTNL